MKTPIYEILGKIAKNPSIPRRVNILRKYKSPQLIEILSYATNPNLTPILDLSYIPPYKVPDGIQMEEEFYKRCKIMKHFFNHCDKPITDLTRVKREALFIQLLENIHPEDAKILIDVMNKKVKFINEDVVKQAFPDEIKF